MSCGLVDGRAVLDLDYAEDSTAEADANFVLAQGVHGSGHASGPGGDAGAGTGPESGSGGGIVEIQGTAEKAPFSEAQFAELMRLARLGTGRLYEMQRAALDR